MASPFFEGAESISGTGLTQHQGFQGGGGGGAENLKTDRNQVPAAEMSNTLTPTLTVSTPLLVCGIRMQDMVRQHVAGSIVSTRYTDDAPFLPLLNCSHASTVRSMPYPSFQRVVRAGACQAQCSGCGLLRWPASDRKVPRPVPPPPGGVPFLHYQPDCG